MIWISEPKMTQTVRILEGVSGFIVIEGPPLAAFVYALVKWRSEPSKAELSAWRRITANLGYLAVGTQATLLLSVFVWPQLSRFPLLSQWAGWVLPTFLIADPFVLTGTGASRWWLLSSSIHLFAFCFVIVLSP